MPFSSLSERLYRIVRQVAKELGKRVNLEIVGAQTELDRSVLEKHRRPARAPAAQRASTTASKRRDARRAAGKSETGEITLTVRQEGNEIVIELADDGGGIDLARVREQGARAAAWSPPTRTPTDAQLVDLIFRAGLLDRHDGHRDLAGAAWAWTSCAPKSPRWAAASRSRSSRGRGHDASRSTCR